MKADKRSDLNCVVTVMVDMKRDKKDQIYCSNWCCVLVTTGETNM